MDALLEIFRSNFYSIDFSIGVLIPVAVIFLRRNGRIDGLFWRLFWIGFALGLTWEAPMQLLNAQGPGLAVHSYTREPPVHFVVIILMHSSWDGGLFLVGAWLTRAVCKAPAFERFSPKELLVLILWGQISELWVELTSISGQAWAYIPRPWNPALFKFSGQNITLLPQLIWLAAPVVFYIIALQLRKKSASK